MHLIPVSRMRCVEMAVCLAISGCGVARYIEPPEAGAVDGNADREADASTAPRAGCAAGARRCGAEQTPETCNGLGDWVRDAQPCPYVCVEGTCGGECRPGSKRCGGADGLTPATCDDGGRWSEASSCPSLCSDGACTGDCKPGTVSCTGAPPVQHTCGPDGRFEDMACPSPMGGTAMCAGAGCDFVCAPPWPHRCGSRCCECVVDADCKKTGFVGTCQPDHSCQLACDLFAYRWRQTTSSGCVASEWTFSGSNASLQGSETGCAGAHGDRGSYDGSVVTMHFAYDNGTIKGTGTYRWPVDSACRTGEGSLTFESGDVSGTFSSTLSIVGPR